MPIGIEILPENHPDWVQFDGKENIGFLGEDPFWKTKAGSSDPEQAILFRGGEGFLDRSVDGGKAWTSILPSIPLNPKWFDLDEMTWEDTYGFSPQPLPDPSIAAPTKYTVTYHSYAGNPAHIGEHAVLASYVVDDGVDTNWDLACMFYVYTYDDWNTAHWQTIPMTRNDTYATITEGSSTTVKNITGIGTSPGWDSPNIPMVRLSDGNFALFYRWHSNNPTYKEYNGCAILSESSGTFSLVGLLDVEGGPEPGTDPYVNGTDVYFISVNAVSGTPDVAYFRAYKWDCSGVTPVYDGLVASIAMPDTLDSTVLAANGRSFMKTDGGLIVAYAALQKTCSVSCDQGYREVFLARFNCSTDTWSTPLLYKSGIAANSIPYTMYMAGISTDVNIAFVVESYIKSWTNMGATPITWYLNTMIMDITNWNIYQWENLVTHTPGASRQYTVNEYAIVKLSGNKIAFNARNYGTKILKYTASSYEFIESDHDYAQYDYGEAHYGERPVREPIPRDRVFWGNNMDWTSDDPSNPIMHFPHKLEVWSEDSSSGVMAYVADNEYGRRWQSGLLLNVSVVTVNDDKPASAKIGERYYIGKMSFTSDGEVLWIPTVDRDESFGVLSPTNFEIRVDEVYRDADGEAGLLSYTDWGIQGQTPDYWRLNTFAQNLTRAQALAKDFFINLDPWPYDSAGIILWGKLFNINPPYQLRVYYNISVDFSSRSIWYQAGFLDPVHAVVYYDERIFAVIKTSTGAELWVSDYPPYAGTGNEMNYLSDCILDSIGFSAMDVDERDGTIVVAHEEADLLMIAATPVPHTVWYNLTLSHRNDRGVTGLIVL